MAKTRTLVAQRRTVISCTRHSMAKTRMTRPKTRVAGIRNQRTVGKPLRPFSTKNSCHQKKSTKPIHPAAAATRAAGLALLIPIETSLLQNHAHKQTVRFLPTGKKQTVRFCPMAKNRRSVFSRAGKNRRCVFCCSFFKQGFELRGLGYGGQAGH